MTESWATFGADLHLELSAGRGLRAGLTEALREAARSGRLAPGLRLPSSRSLAADLGIARNTVAEAYAELVAEGWLTARQGSGTRVAERARARRPAPAAPVRRAVRAKTSYSLMPGSPDLGGFPRAGWLSAARRALSEAPNEAFGYADPRGRPELREALAGYLARARGVHADPERIVLCAGFAQGLVLLARLLRARRVREVAVEGYGLDVHRDLLTGEGLRTRVLEVDAAGACTRALADSGVGAVLLTPAHQFPTGAALTPERRSAAVDWARSTGGLVLEDDYDGEFRYDRQPVGALQGLDPDRVVYLGTASKSLAPGLRMGWMVVPGPLMDEVLAVKSRADWSSSALEQLTLAEFIRSGAYDRHVREMRLRYRRRRDELVAAVGDRAAVSGIAAGLHAVLDLAPGGERAALRAAAWQDLGLQPLSSFRHPDSAAPAREALVVGFGTPPQSAWSATLAALVATLP
ncbi:MULTISPECIES: PLP-dependent aminotransferase family protein [unclassified Streptomyces]|uniref:MocR-like pyridoxine biosynthesis transcription factor PdxR n=1 Tax=unclassified Streptomyces TaxID=2593676 RepID=UPI000DC7EB10|nr:MULTISPECIES: PLP-dependent aminotransferase family protein [unclassified Streptomyces]AWZ04834.1 PLP-dependent aminotransferase family protein [Streptomyces sp. ICC4]AWZ11349.1 PLP-dependent aminotransferase family protein [Streptomyces sp. ICC1]